MVSRSVPAGVHVVTIREQRILFLDSKLFPLVQLVVRFDAGFKHYPLETVFPVLPYRGVEGTAVTIITGAGQMIFFPLFIIDRLPDISLPVATASDSVYYPVHYSMSNFSVTIYRSEAKSSVASVMVIRDILTPVSGFS